MCPRCGLWPERWKQARLMDLFLSALFSDVTRDGADHSGVGEWLDVVGQSLFLLNSDWGNAEHLFHSFCVIVLWLSVFFFLFSSVSLNSQCTIYWEQSGLRKEKRVICWSWAVKANKQPYSFWQKRKLRDKFWYHLLTLMLFRLFLSILSKWDPEL